jgi:hypothetical protein
MFRNLVVVQRFPIPPKPDGFQGLEMTLDIMAALLETSQVVEFKSNLFIKGFSSALFMTKWNGATCQWHHVFNEDETYLSYADERFQHISRHTLTTGRKDRDF